MAAINDGSPISELFKISRQCHRLLALPSEEPAWRARAVHLLAGLERYESQWSDQLEPALTGHLSATSALMRIRALAGALDRRRDRLGPDEQARIAGLIARLPETETTPEGAVFSSDFVSTYQARWSELLSPLRDVRGARGLEVGSFEGRSAIWFLRNVLTGPDARLTCIDTFDMAFQGVPLVGTSAELEHRFEHNLRVCGLRERVDKLAGLSHAVLRGLPLDSFDFAYIDGSHRTDDVLEDAVLAWRLVRVGGVLIFDDYLLAHADQPMIRPGVALDAFIAINPARVEILERGLQLAVRRLA